MPIRPENRALYPPDWAATRRARLEEAGWRCECHGECGVHGGWYVHCLAVHNLPHPTTGSRVVLTRAHLDQDPTNNDPANVRVFCQRCHLAYDRAARAAAGQP